MGCNLGQFPSPPANAAMHLNSPLRTQRDASAPSCAHGARRWVRKFESRSHRMGRSRFTVFEETPEHTPRERERRTPTKSSTPCCFIASGGYLCGKVPGALVKQNAASQSSNILALKSPFRETFSLCVLKIISSPHHVGILG